MAEGIRLIVQSVDSHPVCEHGPALLFERYIDGKCQQFYACSAYRDQKECPLHIPVNQNQLKPYNRDLLLANAEKSLKLAQIQSNLLQKVLNEIPNQRIYCHTCHTFLNNTINQLNVRNHKDHTIQCNISNEQIERPTTFLKSLSNDKREAQYFFSETSLNCFGRIFQQLGINKVICIGAPRLHEMLRKNISTLHIESILLDLDTRFYSFFNRNDECDYFHYNMFNNYFFAGEYAESKFQQFLCNTNKRDKCCIFTDPPFGCRTEPLIFTLHTLSRLYQQINHTNNILPIFWVFPYFMEMYITLQMPEMEMLDYKIDYTNHDTYHSGADGRKQGSPVRLFTNVPLHLIKLPSTESYRFCKMCKKWVDVTNQHCNRCRVCPSKNGDTYIHCYLCEMCVKPTYKHCTNCWRCTQIANHQCTKYQSQLKCMICLHRGHSEIHCEKWFKLCGKSAKEISKLKSKINKTRKRICLICFKHGHNEKSCTKRYEILNETSFLNQKSNLLGSEFEPL